MVQYVLQLSCILPQAIVSLVSFFVDVDGDVFGIIVLVLLIGKIYIVVRTMSMCCTSTIDE